VPLVARWWLALGPVEQLVPGLIDAGHWSFRCVPVTWCAVVNMVMTPCAYARPRDEILWRHAAMAEAGSSETGGGITGRIRQSCLARRTGPDAGLHHVSAMPRLVARRCSRFSPAIPTQDGEPRH
jgi:hypothetical protein